MHVTTGEPAEPGPGRVHARRRNLRRALATLTVVSAVAAAAWWDTHPAVFSDYGNGVGIRNDVDDPALFALTFPEARGGTRSIHVLGIAPHVRSAPPGTTVSASYCADSRGPGGAAVAGMMVARGELTAICRAVGPASGSTLTVGPDAHDQLVLVVTSRRAGRVVVDGATLTYRVGVRFGRQHVGMSSIATFTPQGSRQSLG